LVFVGFVVFDDFDELSKELLRMRPCMCSISGYNVFLNLLPILAMDSQGFQELIVLLSCPSACFIFLAIFLN